MRLTIKDIAAEAKVSVSTVSKCLNNYSDVSEETKRHVIETIQRMDYVPNTFARYVANKPTGVIGLTIPDVRDPYFAQSTYGIEQRLKESGLSLFLGNINRNEKSFLEFILKAREMRFDGLIITPDSWSDDIVTALKNLEAPILSIRRRPPENCPLTYIDADHEKLAKEILEYLYGLGHRKIAHAVIPNEAGIFRNNAYLDFCRECGIETRTADSNYPAAILSDAVMNGEESARKILSNWPDTTAIFAGSDFIALGVMSYLKKIGKRVPEDISVVGVGNNEYSSLPWFNLTTMELHRAEMGEKAAEMLIAMLEGKPQENILFNATLIERGSTRKI